MDKEKQLQEILETLEQLRRSHVSEVSIVEQAEIFQNGLPFVKIARPCTIGDGIVPVNEKDFARLIAIHESAAEIGRIMKFVPASGSATRMFKDLLAVYRTHNSLTFEDLRKNAVSDIAIRNAVSFLDNLDKFAFYSDLESFASEHGKNLNILRKNEEWQQILAFLLSDKGLNYASLPKGLIPFHRYDEKARTPIREQLEEALQYTLTADNSLNIHFTLSSEHLEQAEMHFSAIKNELKSRNLNITTSIQKPSTDTIAVTLENRAFKDASGNLNFRPGGHGALLENLNDLKADIILLKNIDNVTPDRLKADTVLYKKLLCGLLIETQNTVFEFLEKLEAGNADNALLEKILIFARNRLSASTTADFAERTITEKASILFSLLNRPLRVCGMVKNQGEPGGGPFWTIDEKGGVSLQIVESAQVDINNPEQKNILASSTHFNPVDLACAVRNHKGECFDLKAFSNKFMGFITIKSKDGMELKALELPGLWNGAMAFWNTIFVEVPSSTFTPVKTVNDLLRPEHQP